MDATLDALCRRMVNWDARQRDISVTPRLTRKDLLDRLAPYDFSSPRGLTGLVEDIADLLERGGLHSNSPRYFGMFVPGVHRAGIVADAVAAIYNPQLGAWWHAPAATEVERKTLQYLGSRIGREWAECSSTFTSGGSEANLTAALVALARSFPQYAQLGLSGVGVRPVFYASDQAHDSFVKIAQVTGLGRSALRRIRSDPHHALDVSALRQAVAKDRTEGYSPFLVVATVGTTATGAIDPLSRLAALCREEGLWLHADAAWGGLALLSDGLRKHVAGVELADSITWDAHKTLPVPMGAGMFFCRSRLPQRVFAVRPPYLPDPEPGTEDAYQQTIQWSRRFIGLKVFLTLAELGAEGVAKLIDHQASMAQLLRESLASNGWRIVNDSPLPLVCFGRDEISDDNIDHVAKAVVAEGIWISVARLPKGEQCLRACITHHHASPDDVQQLVRAVNRAVQR